MARRPRPTHPETAAEHFGRIAANTRIANEEAAAKREAAAAGIAPPPEREYRYALTPEQRRHGIGGNGGPADEPTAFRKIGAEEHLRLGKLLFGDRYTTDLARVCGEDQRAVYRWKIGEGSAPGTVATFALRREAVARIKALQEAVDALDAFRPPPAAPAPPPPPAPEVILAPGVKPEDAAWFIDRFVMATGGKPTPIRVILAARCPPKGRRWTAEIVMFDGSQQSIGCDRTDDLQGECVGFASGTRDRPEPWIYWDDAANAWARGPDWGSSAMAAQLAEPTAPVPAAPREPVPVNPDRPRGRLGARQEAGAPRPQDATAEPADPQADIEGWLRTTFP